MASHRKALIVCVLLAGCADRAQQPPATSGEPRRIVSLIPAVTETLFAVGAGSKVVGVGSFDAFPPEIATLPKVGGLIDPDTERILSLKPDLAFLYGSQQSLIEQLRAAGIAVETYRHGSVADVIASIRSVGARVGHRQQGEDVAAAIERAFAQTRDRQASAQRPSVLVVFGREPGTLRGIYASGGIGFVNDMIETAGGRNIFADVQRESVQASLESIVQRSPAVILEIRATTGEGREAALLEPWRRVPSLPAVRNNRIHVLLDERLVVPGPRIAEGLAMIEAAIRK